MYLLYIMAAVVFFGIFILFLVLSKTLNSILNHLVKLNYLLQKELDLRHEHAAISQLMSDEEQEHKNTDANAKK